MARPLPEEAAVFYHKYINLVKGNSAQDAVKNHSAEIMQFYCGLPEAKAGYAYADGKWTIQEVLQHVIDAERVFTYRTMRIARKDATPLPGFDENSYAANSEAGARSFAVLKKELNLLRQATDIFITTLTEQQLQNKGTASGYLVTANAIAFVTYGHLLHHINIIRDRYL